MIKRIALPLIALGFVVGIALVRAPDAEAIDFFHVGLVCEPSFNGGFCDAFPFGIDFSYRWSSTGQLTVTGWGPAGTNSPSVIIFCNGSGDGTVTVDVSKPDGSFGSASRRIYCR